jgi:DNA-binding protein HU-beta
MNKQELITAVSKKTGLSKSQILNIANSILNTIETTLKKGSSVQLVGFGTWNVRRRAARMGRNPQTGAKIKIPARKVPVFSAGQKLKDAVH